MAKDVEILYSFIGTFNVYSGASDFVCKFGFLCGELCLIFQEWGQIQMYSRWQLLMHSEAFVRKY